MKKSILIIFFLLIIECEGGYVNDPITEISFSIDWDIYSCYKTLTKKGYITIQGDIRQGAGGRYCAIGIKRFFQTNQQPITNIIGRVSWSNQPDKIVENGIEYKLIYDDKKNGDIHKSSGGNYLHLYYTKDTRAGLPIKDIAIGSYSHPMYCGMEVAQHAKKSKGTGPLDINTGRGGPYNYILIFR